MFAASLKFSHWDFEMLPVTITPREASERFAFRLLHEQFSVLGDRFF